MTDTVGTNAPAPGSQTGGGNVTEQAKEKVGEVADQARQGTQQMRERGRSKLREMVDERSSQAGQRVHSSAQSLRKVSEQLRNDGQDAPARLAEQVAEKGEQVAGYLRTTDGEQMMRDAENLARRNPWAVIAGGVAIGFIASRFLKSAADWDQSGRAYMYPSQRGSKFTDADAVSVRKRSEVRDELGTSGEIVVETRDSSARGHAPVVEGR
ncbi:MAG: hypothetical protein GEU78_00690 [Actinobacteria bacterium]|nr:hypothetical protein [Actinomycetota bacterium]